jgi:hypothetical protein
MSLVANTRATSLIQPFTSLNGTGVSRVADNPTRPTDNAATQWSGWNTTFVLSPFTTASLRHSGQGRTWLFPEAPPNLRNGNASVPQRMDTLAYDGNALVRSACIDIEPLV